MNELVFLDSCAPSAMPYTTSDLIAEYAQIKHSSIQRLILKHEKDLESYGQVGFEIRAVPYERGTNESKVYRLNEQQATLLITYLKNTEPVREFKKELVRQFFLMRDELYARRAARTESKSIRRDLTDTIRRCMPDSPHKCFAYKQYTDLIYKLTTGKTAAQLRKEHGSVKSTTAADLLTVAELNTYNALQERVCILIELGMNYEEIKARLSARPIPSHIHSSAG